MKAKDTVMGTKELAKFCNTYTNDYGLITKIFFPEVKLDDILKAQAEISFKAGIKEVVEWFSSYYAGLLSEYSGHNKYLIPRVELQAKLKEWGL